MTKRNNDSLRIDLFEQTDGSWDWSVTRGLAPSEPSTDGFPVKGTETTKLGALLGAMGADPTGVLCEEYEDLQRSKWERQRRR